MALLSNRSIPTRGRAPQPISCEDSGFLWIEDAFYALSGTSLPFFSELHQQTRDGFSLQKQPEEPSAEERENILGLGAFRVSNSFGQKKKESKRNVGWKSHQIKNEAIFCSRSGLFFY